MGLAGMRKVGAKAAPLIIKMLKLRGAASAADCWTGFKKRIFCARPLLIYDSSFFFKSIGRCKNTSADARPAPTDQANPNQFYDLGSEITLEADN